MILDCNRYNGGSLMSKSELGSLVRIGNKPIREICKKHPGLLVFPNCIEDSLASKYDDPHVFDFVQDEECDDNIIIYTNTIMGFIGNGKQSLTISSRFDRNEHKNYFLQYMLEKVFSINMFDLPVSSDTNTTAFDLMLLFLPYFLNKAVSQGLFRSYKTSNYNDARIKGSIDVTRFLRKDFPFRGNVAYSVREYVHDNDLTQLVRHTIEYVRTQPIGKRILNVNQETQASVAAIIECTPSYSKQKRYNVIQKNLRPINHPYYTAYKTLQKLCLQILRHEKIGFGKADNNVNGLLFDGAWLWEEYVAHLIDPVFTHYTYNSPQRFYLFQLDNGAKCQNIIPDYLAQTNNGTFVADAKYIPLGNNSSLSADRAESIYYKTIMYMYRFNSKHGFLFFPHSLDYDGKSDLTRHIIDVPGACINEIGLKVPNYTDKSLYSDFVKKMKVSEDLFNDSINNALTF